jgi:surface antigen
MFKGLKSKKMVKNETSCNRFSDSKNCPSCNSNQKLKQAQIQDLNLFAEKAKKGKVTLKEYKPVSLEEQEKLLIEEEDKALERAPNVTPIYYYHPDHLGTSTALTDFNGNAYQIEDSSNSTKK